MKGRIEKNFEAEGRTALEKESDKGHHQWRTQGFGKGGGHHRGPGGRSSPRPTNFYDFHIKNTHFSTLFYRKRACSEWSHYGHCKNISFSSFCLKAEAWLT